MKIYRILPLSSREMPAPPDNHPYWDVPNYTPSDDIPHFEPSIAHLQRHFEPNVYASVSPVFLSSSRTRLLVGRPNEFGQPVSLEDIKGRNRHFTIRLKWKGWKYVEDGYTGGNPYTKDGYGGHTYYYLYIDVKDGPPNVTFSPYIYITQAKSCRIESSQTTVALDENGNCSDVHVGAVVTLAGKHKRWDSEAEKEAKRGRGALNFNLSFGSWRATYASAWVGTARFAITPPCPDKYNIQGDTGWSN